MCAPQALLLWPHNQMRRVGAIVKCVVQREVHGKRRRGRRKSNMTPHSGNIATWMGRNVEEIMRDRAIGLDGGNLCEVLQGRRIVIPDGTVTEGDD